MEKLLWANLLQFALALVKIGLLWMILKELKVKKMRRL